MSKITIDGLTRSGTERMLYSNTHMAAVDVKGLTSVSLRWIGTIIASHAVDCWIPADEWPLMDTSEA